jgi:hypothetical protein
LVLLILVNIFQVKGGSMWMNSCLVGISIHKYFFSWLNIDFEIGFFFDFLPFSDHKVDQGNFFRKFSECVKIVLNRFQIGSKILLWQNTLKITGKIRLGDFQLFPIFRPQRVQGNFSQKISQISKPAKLFQSASKYSKIEFYKKIGNSIIAFNNQCSITKQRFKVFSKIETNPMWAHIHP